MFKNDFIVAVRCGGQILREVGDLVSLPFGSEYSLLLKNKSSRKAVVKVEIDGQDVLDGDRLVVNPNGEIDLQGFMEHRIGPLPVAKNRFKFIKKTQEIVEHRGDKIDDGIVRVEFQYEKCVRETIQETVIHRRHVYYDPPCWLYPWTQPWDYPRYPYYGDHFYCSSGTVAGGDISNITTNSVPCGASSDAAFVSDNLTLTNSASMPEIKEDEGITVKGSEVNQGFNYAPTNELESNSEVIILKLKGTTNGDKVKAAVTVHGKVQCDTCGRKSKAGTKFCANCGTALGSVIVTEQPGD